MSDRLSFGKNLRYIGEAIPFFLFMALFRLMGLDAASRLGGWIGRTFFSRLPPDRVARATGIDSETAFSRAARARGPSVPLPPRLLLDRRGRALARIPAPGAPPRQCRHRREAGLTPCSGRARELF